MLDKPHAAELRRCLIDCDVAAIRRLWAHVSPGMPQPESDSDTLICIHMARTGSDRLPFKYRAYSHSWLRDNGYPSQLPDHLKPNAERLYPRIVSAVGVCVAGMGNHKTDYHRYAEGQLCDVVENFYADGIEDPDIIRPAMRERYLKIRKQR